MNRFARRLPWLVFGLVASSLITIVMVGFEHTLAANVSVAFFVPALVYIAGAIGRRRFQSASAVWRRRSADPAPTARRIIIGIGIGAALGALAAARCWPSSTTSSGRRGRSRCPRRRHDVRCGGLWSSLGRSRNWVRPGNGQRPDLHHHPRRGEPLHLLRAWSACWCCECQVRVRTCKRPNQHDSRFLQEGPKKRLRIIRHAGPDQGCLSASQPFDRGRGRPHYARYLAWHRRLKVPLPTARRRDHRRYGLAFNLPHACEVSHRAVAPRSVRCLRDGRRARRLLHRMLLGPDGASLRRRGHEPLVDRRVGSSLQKLWRFGPALGAAARTGHSYVMHLRYLMSARSFLLPAPARVDGEMMRS